MLSALSQKWTCVCVTTIKSCSLRGNCGHQQRPWGLQHGRQRPRSRGYGLGVRQAHPARSLTPKLGRGFGSVTRSGWPRCEPPRFCRKLVGLGRAAIAAASIWFVLRARLICTGMCSPGSSATDGSASRIMASSALCEVLSPGSGHGCSPAATEAVIGPRPCTRLSPRPS